MFGVDNEHRDESYTPEFKAQAMVVIGKPVPEVAEELGRHQLLQVEQKPTVGPAR